MAGWIYAFFPQAVPFIHLKHFDWMTGLIAALVAISLPIGYIISIISQAVYLDWRRCFQRWHRVRGWLGFHGAAMDRIPSLRCPQPQFDEELNEANALLLTSRKGDIDSHRYMRDWISRRMDVVAINLSVIYATVLALYIALLLWLLPGKSPLPLPTIIFLISLLVIVFMFFSIIVLRRQIIEVITGIYQRYGERNQSPADISNQLFY